MSNEVAVTTAAPEPQWAAFVALDWADQKHYWRLAEASSQKQEQGELDNTPRSGGGVGRGFERTFRGAADRRVFGADAGRVGLHAAQVPAVGAVSGTPQDGRQYAGGLPPVRRQGRSQRHSGAADHPVMPSRPVTGA